MRCFAPAVLGLLIAGCCGGGGEAPRNMSREEVTAEVSDIRVTPGEWEQTTQVLRAEAPDLPLEMVARMRQRRASRRYCITPEQAAQPVRVSDAIARPSAGCSVRDFRMRSGRMEGQMVCQPGTPAEVTTAMSGSYSPDNFDYRSQVQMPAPMGGGVMRLDVRTTGRRIGPCPAGGETRR